MARQRQELYRRLDDVVGHAVAQYERKNPSSVSAFITMQNVMN